MSTLWVPAALMAQDHVEVGAFADYFRLSQVNPNINFVGVGGRAAFNVHPNVQIEAEATETLSFPFGVQKSVMHLDRSSSESSPRGLQEFRISPSDVSRIHSILALKLLFLDTLTINKVLSQTVAHLTMLNDNEATRISQGLTKD